MSQLRQGGAFENDSLVEKGAFFIFELRQSRTNEDELGKEKRGF